MSGEDALGQRFWSKVDKSGDCWIWTGAIRDTGYGNYNLGRSGSEKRSYRLPHRLAYEVLVGPIPAGRELDHLCRVRACINPSHLEPVIHRDNSLRGAGVGAINVRKQFCPKGHPYDLLNTYFKKPGNLGRRACRKCHAMEERSRKARLRAQRSAVQPTDLAERQRELLGGVVA